MTIAAGTTLGRYEVRSLLGKGGMGEVYLAQDTQLRRLVALKLLPATFTQDEDRLRRFEQEAYAASALNHPNILTIYEIGHVDSTRFIAMEYVDGEMLRQHISRSPSSSSPEGTSPVGSGMKLGQALDLAIQIASALAASQSAGIAHRDIKPENIMLRRDGYVKVLDFGLAKLSERPTTSDTEAPTRALINTSPGAVMGTANYMSPEQARGEIVDARSDIWSLGVVLYEMIAGRVPFEGPTPSHVIVSILEKDPPPLSMYLVDLPEALEWIVTKALTKDRDDRYQTAREMLTDLRRLKQRLDVGAELERSVAPDRQSGGATISSGQIQPASQAVGTSPSEQRTTIQVHPSTVSSAEYLATSIGRHKLGWGIAAIAFVAVVVGGAFLWSRLRTTDSTPTFKKVRLSQLTNTGKATMATISPDGKYVVHVVSDGTHSSLWVRQTATSSNVQIAEPAESRYIGLTFSQDGNYVYYVVYEKTNSIGLVYQIPVLGGNPRKIIEDVDTPISFSPEGKRFAFVRNYPGMGETALFIANSDGSGEQKIASRQRPRRFTAGPTLGPSWSPSEDLIVCPAAGPENGKDLHSLVGIDLKNASEKEITRQRWPFIQQVVLMPHNQGLILSGQEQLRGPNQLWYVDHSGGEVERITNDLNNYNGVSVSADGNTIATVQSQTISSVWLAPNSKAEAAVKLTSGTSDGSAGVALMPDGRVLYTIAGVGTSDIFVVDADGTNPHQLTSDAGLNGLPSVSDDGRYIVFISSRNGGPHIWRMNSDGSNVKQITNGIAELNPIISPDGQWIIYQDINDLRLWKIPIEGGTPSRLFGKLAGQAVVSPDGKLIACRYREEDLSPFKIGILSFASGEILKTIDAPVIRTNLEWTPDSRAVLYGDARGGVTNIWSQPIDGGPANQVTQFKTDQIFLFDLSSDGKQMLLVRGNVSDDVVLIADVKS